MLTDDEVKEILGQIEPLYRDSYCRGSLYLRELFRLLAESQNALREIANIRIGTYESPYEHGPEPNIDTRYSCESCGRTKRIARNAVKGE